MFATKGQHQWYTVQGGSVEYVRRLQSALERRGRYPAKSAVTGVPQCWGATVNSERALPEFYDEVVGNPLH